MKKASIIILGIILIIVCIIVYLKLSSNSLTFKGESEDWTAEYRVYNIVTSINEDGNDVYTADKKLIVTYKNDLIDLSKVKNWEISYKCRWYGGKQSETRTDNDDIINKKTFVINCGSLNDMRIDEKKDLIKVSVNIDGEIQNLELKYKW